MAAVQLSLPAFQTARSLATSATNHPSGHHHRRGDMRFRKAVMALVNGIVAGAVAFSVAPTSAQTKKKPITKKLSGSAQTMQQAIAQNSLDRVKQLLGENAELLNQLDPGQGYTPLLWATTYNRPEIPK